MINKEQLDYIVKSVVGQLQGKPVGPTEEVNIIKSLSEEEQIATEVVYVANQLDSHDNFARPETLAQLVKALNNPPENFEYNIHHNSELTTTGFKLLKAYQIDKDMSIDTTGEVIPAGSVLADIHYSDENLWKMKKSGILAGLSIGCKGTVTEEEVEI